MKDLIFNFSLKKLFEHELSEPLKCRNYLNHMATEVGSVVVHNKMPSTFFCRIKTLFILINRLNGRHIQMLDVICQLLDNSCSPVSGPRDSSCICYTKVLE